MPADNASRLFCCLRDTEPSVQSLLTDDPAISLMQADRIEAQEVYALVDRLRRAQRRPPEFLANAGATTRRGSAIVGLVAFSPAR